MSFLLTVFSNSSYRLKKTSLILTFLSHEETRRNCDEVGPNVTLDIPSCIIFKLMFFNCFTGIYMMQNTMVVEEREKRLMGEKRKREKE